MIKKQRYKSSPATKRDVETIVEKIVDKKTLPIRQDVSMLNFRVSSLEDKFKEFQKEFSDFKDRVLTNLDWLVGAFKKFDEEHTILSQRYIDMGDKLDNHETRIKILEKTHN